MCVIAPFMFFRPAIEKVTVMRANVAIGSQGTYYLKEPKLSCKLLKLTVLLVYNKCTIDLVITLVDICMYII